MCGQAAALNGAALQPPAAPGLPERPPGGSRRRRVWELAEHAYCPVIGVCLPVQALRRLVDRVLDGEALASDYELHCGVIAECKQRGPIAEAVQRELDRRHATALRGAASCKHAEALADWWAGAPARGDVAGALWAVLSHARCDAALEEQVLRDMHMLQHQVGAAARADLRRLDALQRRHAALEHELARLRERSSTAAQAQARRIEQAESTAVQLRAELIGRDSRISALEQRLRQLEAAAPGLESRLALRDDNRHQLERVQQLQRALQRAELALPQARRGHPPAAVPHTPPDAQACEDSTGPAGKTTSTGTTRLPLARHAVLCVGGRRASVPVYRALIERVGGRFLQHDGGDEDSAARLDATLLAADLVICQTGCLSHDAYWRVKSHCRRTGTRCLFVENPSATSLQRALDTLPVGDCGHGANAPEPR